MEREGEREMYPFVYLVGPLLPPIFLAAPTFLTIFGMEDMAFH